MLWFMLYLGTIIGANAALAHFGFVSLGFGLMAPAGVLFAGAALSLRDMVQESCGKRWTLAAILAGAAISYLFAPSFAVASGAAFLLSELADFAVYTPLREHSHWLAAVVVSNTAGDIVDSILFLWLAFGSLDYLSGQLVGKWLMTVPFLALMWGMRYRRAEPAAA